MKWSVKPSTAYIVKYVHSRGRPYKLFVKSTQNHKFAGFWAHSAFVTCNFHDLSAKLQIRKFLHNAAQICLKPVLKFFFLKQLLNLDNLNLLQKYLQEKKVCICWLAEVLSPQQSLGSANGKSTNYESANHKIDLARNLQNRSAPFVEGQEIY